MLTDLPARKDQIDRIVDFEEKCTEYSLNVFQPDGFFRYKLQLCTFVLWQLLLLLSPLLLHLLELAVLLLLLCIGLLSCAAKCGSTMLLGLCQRM